MYIHLPNIRESGSWLEKRVHMDENFITDNGNAIAAAVVVITTLLNSMYAAIDG